jgi:peroxiredoxin
MSRSIIITALLLCTGAMLFAGDKKSVENFSLPDYNGRTISLSNYDTSKAIVLMFIATQCPVSNAYNERYVQLYNDYSGKQIAFIAINSNKAESADEIRTHAKEHGFVFPVLKDENNIIADKLGAERTPEIFVLRPSSHEVLYHGRIDDAQRESKITSRDLRSALDEILSGKPVTVKETKAFGCTIKRVN